MTKSMHIQLRVRVNAISYMRYRAAAEGTSSRSVVFNILFDEGVRGLGVLLGRSFKTRGSNRIVRSTDRVIKRRGHILVLEKGRMRYIHDLWDPSKSDGRNG